MADNDVILLAAHNSEPPPYPESSDMSSGNALVFLCLLFVLIVLVFRNRN
jgi:hypothetical protein